MVFNRKEYMKEYWIKRKTNPEVMEKRKNQKAKYYQKNKDKIKAKQREYYQANKEKINQRNKEWIKNNPEKIKEREKKYYKTNKEKIKDRQKEWQNKNKKICTCGNKMTYKSIRCNSCASKINSTFKEGEKNPSWKGGISKEPYDQNWTNKFKRAIRKRDNQICMLCGIHREKLKQALSIHHINHNKKLSISQNCISLCQKCHKGIVHKDDKKQNEKQNWTKLFQEKLTKLYDYQYAENQEIILNLGENK